MGASMQCRVSPALFISVLALGGCSGPDSCERYSAELNACMTAAGVDRNDAVFDANTCDTLDGEPYPAYFACVAEALAEVDCSTTVGIRAASAATAPCRAMLTVPRIDETLNYFR
jgi:hypothetical protein